MRNALIGTLSPELLKRISSFNQPEALNWTLQSHRPLTVECICGKLVTDNANHQFRRGYLCSPCFESSRKKVPVNNLVAIESPLLSEWDYERNELGAEWFTEMSGKKAWWLGACGHQYFSKIARRSGGSGCPICNGKQIEPGINDLASQYPRVAKEWHPTKNELKADQVAPKSNKLIWWLCENGHEWQQKPLKRTAGWGCGKCSRSQFEKDFSLLFSELGISTIENDRNLIAPYELDLVIPEANVAIELNGDFWHSESEIQKSRGVSALDFHRMKFERAKELDYRLLFIWEDDWKSRKLEVVAELQKYLSDPTGEIPLIFSKLSSSRVTKTKAAQR